jgi:DNA-binding NarL/FixJ family response regulator
MRKINVILADDHSLIRYALRKYLSKSDDIEIVGEASTSDECIQLYKDLSPDVCVIDIGMPGKSGIDAVHAIRDEDRDVKILILSMYSSGPMMRKALQADINGYLLKNSSKTKIQATIRAIAGGQKVFSKSIAKGVSTPPDIESSPATLQHYGITAREKEIIELVVAGYSSPQIADQLYISRRTVDTHRNNIMRKLDINNTASLVRFALMHNLVDDS